MPINNTRDAHNHFCSYFPAGGHLKTLRNCLETAVAVFYSKDAFHYKQHQSRDERWQDKRADHQNCSVMCNCAQTISTLIRILITLIHLTPSLWHTNLSIGQFRNKLRTHSFAENTALL